jgi:hypothetical protein
MITPSRCALVDLAEAHSLRFMDLFADRRVGEDLQ